MGERELWGRLKPAMRHQILHELQKAPLGLCVSELAGRLHSERSTTLKYLIRMREAGLIKEAGLGSARVFYITRVRCSKCGAENGGDWDFCVKCGDCLQPNC